jgi:hypothetical protein
MTEIILWTEPPRVFWTVKAEKLGEDLSNPAYAPQPNETFNADANIGHRVAILMANVGTLRPCRASGAG